MVAVPGLAHPDYWGRGDVFPPPGPPPPPAHQGVGPSLHSYAREYQSSGSRAITGGHHSRPASGSSFKKGGGSNRRQFRSTSDSDTDIFEQASSEVTVVTVHHDGEDPERIPPSGSPAKRSKGLCTTLAKTTLESTDLVV